MDACRLRGISLNPIHLHVLVACYNRVASTSAAVGKFYSEARSQGFLVKFYFFDDGSTDGTVDYLSGLTIDSEVHFGDGNFYWSKSMAYLERNLLDNCDINENDYIVWLNDDVIVNSTSFLKIKNNSILLDSAILVGSLVEPYSSAISYGGVRKRGKHPMGFSKIGITHEFTSVDTFNGNLVFMKLRTARILNGIENRYSHGLGDIDFGLRAVKEGFKIFQIPGISGECKSNQPQKSSLVREFSFFVSRKGGGNFRSLWIFFKKFTPVSAPFWMFATYLNWIVRRLFKDSLKRNIHASIKKNWDK